MPPRRRSVIAVRTIHVDSQLKHAPLLSSYLEPEIAPPRSPRGGSRMFHLRPTRRYAGARICHAPKVPHTGVVITRELYICATWSVGVDTERGRQHTHPSSRAATARRRNSYTDQHQFLDRCLVANQPYCSPKYSIV